MFMTYQGDQNEPDLKVLQFKKNIKPIPLKIG